MSTTICVIGPVPPLKGGISQHTARIAEAFGRQDGTQVRVLSWRSQYPRVLYGRDQTDPSVEAHPGARFHLRWWNPLTWIDACRAARRSDIVVMPWVVPVHAPIQWLLAVTGTAARQVVFHVHNPTPHEPMLGARLLARGTLRRADLLVVHASVLRDELTSMGIERPTLTVMHPPDLPAVPTPLPAAKPLRLLCFGHVRPYKGFDLAVQALAELRARGVDASLTIAGEPWGDLDLAKIAHDLGVARQVDLRLQYLPDDDLLALLADHHMVLGPYRSATQSGVVSLALAAGRPVVATAVGGLPELVDDGHNGVLVEPNDPVALADGVIKVADDLGGFAERAGGTVPTWDDMARLVLAALAR